MTEDATTREVRPLAHHAPVAGRTHANPFWGGVIAAGFAFAVTCLVSVAASFGDAQGPMNQWAIRYGTTLITVEAAVLITSALLAMTVDRRLTVRQLKQMQTRRHPVETPGVRERDQ